MITDKIKNLIRRARIVLPILYRKVKTQTRRTITAIRHIYNRTRNLYRCVVLLRGYKSRRLRYIAYYSSFTNGYNAIHIVRKNLEHGDKQTLTYTLTDCRGYLYECYSNGFVQDWYEFNAMYRTAAIYKSLCDNAWWAICIYDFINLLNIKRRHE